MPSMCFQKISLFLQTCKGPLLTLTRAMEKTNKQMKTKENIFVMLIYFKSLVHKAQEVINGKSFMFDH